MEKDKLRKLQLIQLEMALEVKRICEKYKLSYFLINGTLIGAVRHKGFIPWDDDMDIGMPREDYDKFIQLCQTELDNKYYLHCHETDTMYWHPYAKIRKNGTLFNEKPIKNLVAHKGIFIDIFPYDNVPVHSTIWLTLQIGIIRVLSAIIQQKCGLEFGHETNRKLKVLLLFAKPFQIKTLAKLQRKIMTFGKNYTKAYWMSFGNHNKAIIPEDKYLPLKELEFEGEMFKVPSDYDYVLTSFYGDYMTLPPIEQRVEKHAIEVRFNDNTCS